MRKFSMLCIILAAVLLTSCAENNEELTSAVPTETTSLTLTVSLTEPEPEPLPEPVPYIIEFAIYDPFADAVKVENPVRNELAEAVEKLSDARGFLYADFTCFYLKSAYNQNYADTSNALETNNIEDYEYCPLNKDIAQTEEELTQYMRSCFTENFISDEDLQKTLFEAENERVPAEYKTIDGTLCMKQQYMGVAPDIQFDKFSVLEYDGTSAKVAAYGEGPAYPPYMIFMEIVKSEEYGWRLDGIEIKNCWQNEAEVLYNAVTLRAETLNKILDGGNAPENAKTIEIDGEIYTQTDLDMTLPEMLGFFGEIFQSNSNTKTYIEGVYAERDGVLYRKNSAPRWYLPEMRLDPCYGIEHESGSNGNGNESELTCEQEFYDSVTGESFTKKIRVVFSSEYLGYNEEERRQEFEYEYIHITSELPIRELGGEEMNIKPVKLSGKAEDITDEQLKELYDYAYKTVYGKEFLKDGSGSFLTKEGKNLGEYKEEFKQTFTDRYADEYFKLEKGGTYFKGDSQFLELFVLREENSVDDISVFGGYSGIYVGFGAKGSDLSVRDNELTVTSRSGDKIVLTMTVWHVDPENELKIGEDYAYRLENGNLVIAGKFGGWDDNGNQIVIDDELSGTIAEVPVGSDISEFYQKHYTDYLVKYDYDLVLDDGVWKFDNFYIWD